MKTCQSCSKEIPEERLEALPDTEYCKECSEKKISGKVGFMVFSHKTAPSLVLIDPKDKEALRRAERAAIRGR